MTASVLTIAGFDPSGGAGLQADLRVFAAAGLAGLSAVTAVTVQDSTGVHAVEPVDPDLLAAQLDAVFQDARDLRAVKIGMLAGAAHVNVVAESLRRYRPPNVVLDPVLASTGGFPLLDGPGLDALRAELLPLCDLVTPNRDELPRLAGTSVDAVARLHQLGAEAVLVKGGHGDTTDAVDELSIRDRATALFSAPRLATVHTHGTGCFLASSIATGLALGLGLREAVDAAKRLLTRALASPVVAGRGRGYPGPLEGPDLHDERLRRLSGLYVIVGSRPGRSAEEIAEAAIAGGAQVIQLREKTAPLIEVVETAKRLRRLTSARGALFIVNDRVDVALASDADGVHLGPDDLHPADARRILGPSRLIGISASTVDDARPLAPWASYIGVGALFGSTTKKDAGPPIGPARLAEFARAFPRHQIVAIGGIDAANIAEVSAADAAAVISAVADAPDVRAATARLLELWRSGRKYGGRDS